MSALLDLDAVDIALGRALVVRGFSMRVAAGEIVAILGPNGAGKTSVLRAALGLTAPQAGLVSLSGADPRAMAPRERARCAAYMPQKPEAVWPVSVETLVALGRFAHGGAPERLQPADQAAVNAALSACNVDALRKRRMDQLSGGERMRAHLARALAQEAPLLLLDEPTAGLDPAQALGVVEILRQHVSAGGGACFSTHDIALAAACADRVILMRDGAIVSVGPPRIALTAEALRQAYGRPGRLESIGGDLAVVFT